MGKAMDKYFSEEKAQEGNHARNSCSESSWSRKFRPRFQGDYTSCSFSWDK